MKLHWFPILTLGVINHANIWCNCCKCLGSIRPNISHLG